MCDQIIVAGRKAATETQVDEIEDYDYDNAADRDDYCPDVEEDAYGEHLELRTQTSQSYMNNCSKERKTINKLTVISDGRTELALEVASHLKIPALDPDAALHSWM